MKSNLLRILALSVCLALGGRNASAGGNTVVDLELALLLDVSGSVDSTEFALQRTGYVNAFNDAAVQAAIAATSNGIAVALVYWSGAAQQSLAVNWTYVHNAAQASALATAINGTSRPFSGNTAPGNALNFITPLFASNTFDGARQVIDVSGDGAANEGATTLTARNAALAAGVDQINGLPILGEAGLLAFYQNNIQGGTDSFTLPAASFADFDAAIKSKLQGEITNNNPTVPDAGSTLALLGIAISGFGFARRFIA